MGKFIIDNSELANEFFADARLIGIQCPMAAHQFVWQINRLFGYRFTYQPHCEIVLKAQRRTYTYPVYTCAEAHVSLQHYIYINEHDGKHLMPELKHMDYLWLMKGEWREEGLKESLMQELRRMEGVQLVWELTSDKIRNKEHLIL